MLASPLWKAAVAARKARAHDSRKAGLAIPSSKPLGGLFQTVTAEIANCQQLCKQFSDYGGRCFR